MSAAELRARAAELREAGRKLRARPARETLECLGRVLDGWRDPGSSWRRELEARLPEQTGFHPATLREGLDRGLAPWSARALSELVRRELGDAETAAQAGFEVSAVVLAGQIPMPSLLSIVAPLALRSPVLVKSASRDPLTPALVARSILETDAELGRCVSVLDFPGGDRESTDALLEADCVVANGSDETLAALASRLAPSRRWVGYGHRVSAAVIGGDATREPGLAVAARAAALDVALWDQLGCLSPIALYVLDGDPGAAERAAEALAAALAEIELRLPRGTVGAGPAAAIAWECADAEMRAAAGRPVTLRGGPPAGWSVVCEEDERVRSAPLHRFVRVHGVRDAGALARALRPLARHLAALGTAGLADPERRALAELGASRICPLGTLQSPPLDWPRDGRPVLLPLARLVRHEPH